MTDKPQNPEENVGDHLLKIGCKVGIGWSLKGYLRFESPIDLDVGCYTENSSIGAFSYIRQSASIRNADIGRYCSIAARSVVGVEQHPTNGLTSSIFPYDDSYFSYWDGFKPLENWKNDDRVTVGHDVWIGRHVTIMPGIKIQSGAIIGAGSVVTKNVEAYAIAVGIPARIKRKRFNDKIIERLLNLQWWNYDIRSWLMTNKNIRTIPLEEETLSIIEESVSLNKIEIINASKKQIYSGTNGLEITKFT